jgi:hypothetical protein
MPVINDSTVVASAYTTSASARPQRLSNGWLISLVSVSANVLNLYKSIDNGITWTLFTSYNVGFPVYGYSIATKGNDIYVVHGLNASGTYYIRSKSWHSDGTVIAIIQEDIDTAQSSIGSCSLAINSTGTELHACWSSKNATYPNSFNVRYAKGTIAVNGSVTWGTVEQVNKNNDGTHMVEPSIIILPNNKVIILARMNVSGSERIMCFTNNYITKQFVTLSDTWGNKEVYLGSTYAQSSPSAIFVPPSINGLVNGRIWVAWHGTDSTDNVVNNIRSSYSDDLGVTWATMVKHTTGNTSNQDFPSVTANKSNVVRILYNSNSYGGVRKISNINGAWGTIANASGFVNGLTTYPSCLYDITCDCIEPLFIYKNSISTKVGFYGSWIVTTISVVQGAIGSKSDKANLLAYSITTDGTMSTITESVNGITVGTKTATSGQSLITGLTQAQWDAVKYGKYKDVTGGLNTLTVSMGTDIWTYTFDKRLATTDDITSAMKAVQDTQSTMLPSIKAKLASAIRSKGGNINDTDSFDNIVNAVGTLANVISKKWATGYFADNNNINTIDLNFTPSIVLWGTDGANSNGYIGAYTDIIGSFKTYGKDIRTNLIYDNWSSSSDYGSSGTASKYYNALAILSNQIKIRGHNGGSAIRWIAIE